MPRHKRDWKQYNKQLINRGNLNFWITKKSLKFWKAKKRKKAGRPFTYSDEAILAMLMVRFKYQLPLRELEGLFQFLAKLLGIPQVPSYTQVCGRMKTLELSEELQKKKATDLVLDTTGLKVYGEGEWCTKRYGGKAKWIKLHVGIDENGKLILAEVTKESVHDTACLEKALKRCNRRKGKVLIDGIADSKRCYETCRKTNKQLLTPPSRKGVLRKEPEYTLRNEALRIIKGLGGDELARAIWAKLTGYSQRSEIESKIACWKKLVGEGVKSQSLEKIRKEVKIKAMILNELMDQRQSA
ncbi:MAG: IS5 family transposase [Chlamydiota bacterium]